MIFKIFLVLFCTLFAEKSNSEQKHGSNLVLYKDKCVANIKLKIPNAAGHYSLAVPASVDTQSVLFSNFEGNLPGYILKKDNEKSLHTFLNIIQNLGFDGEVSYGFSGINWHMHYVIEISSAFDEILNFNAFISIDNQSGIDFENTQLRLVDAQTDMLSKHQDFSEYVFENAVSIENKNVVRLPWVHEKKQTCSQDYIMDVGGDNLKDLDGCEKDIPLQVLLKFSSKNAKKKGLSKGNIELYVRDKKGVLRYVGSSLLSNVSGNEFINLGLPSYLLSQLNSSGDSPLLKIKGSLEQTEFKVLLAEKVCEAAYRLIIKNSGDKEVAIKVLLPFAKINGKVIRENIEHLKEDDNKFYWPLKIKPNSEVVLRYRVQLMQKG